MNRGNDFWMEDEIRKQLSISTLVFFQFKPICERTLAELTSNGIYRIELLESPEQYDMANSRSMKYMHELFKSCGIQVVAYHAHKTHFNDIGAEQARIERVNMCRHQIDTMMELGGTVWGCHARAGDSVVLKSYEDLARHVEGTPAVITVENLGKGATHVQDRVAFLDTLHHEHIGMILDIGHVRNEQGENPMTIPGGPTETLALCGNHLKHLHLHGFKDGRDHHPPMADGDTIQWIELFENLWSVKYPGSINFEPHGEPDHSTSLELTSRFPKAIVTLRSKL